MGGSLGTLWGRSGDALVTLWDALARRRHRRTNRRRGGGGGGVGKEMWRGGRHSLYIKQTPDRPPLEACTGII